MVLIFLCSPLFNSTVGPSMVSQGVMAAALPGSSTFICEPIAMNSSTIYIETGLIEAAANPESLDLPYLSLNPPGRFGYPKTGLPAIISRRYFCELSPFSSFLFLPMFSSIFHSSIFIRLVYFSTFRDFWISPSHRTRHIPPRIRFVGILLISLCPDISSSSLPSPSIITGELPITRRISSGVGRYCRCFDLLYACISSI